MKRRALWAAATLALVLLAIGFMPWSLARSTLDGGILIAFERATGLKAQTGSPARLALLPKPRIILSDAVLSDPHSPTQITASRIRGNVDLLALVQGRMELDEIDLVAPQITLAAKGSSASLMDWIAPLAAQPQLMEGLPRIIIRDGTLLLKDGASLISTLSKVNLVIAARDANEPFLIAGKLGWRGEDTQVSLLWPVNRSAPAAKIDLSAPAFSLAFAGSAPAGAPLRGKISVEMKDVPRALSWLGETSLLSSLAGRLALAGDLSWNGQDITLSPLQLDLDDDRLDGALSLKASSSGRWALAGTLAGSTMDLDALIERSRLARYLGGDQMRARLSLGSVTPRDIDLRISLESARLGQLALTDLALQFLAGPDRLDINLARASLGKGSIKSRIGLIQPTPDGPVEMKIAAGLERADMAQLAADLGQRGRIAGLGFGQITAEGSGMTMAEILPALSGRASLMLRQGEVAGFSLADLIKKSESQRSLALQDWQSGRTVFESAMLSGAVQQGVWDISDGAITSAAFRLKLAGKLHLMEQRLALTGVIAPPSGPNAYPFTLEGPWRQLRIAPDMAEGASPTPASAPLFQR